MAWGARLKDFAAAASVIGVLGWAVFNAAQRGGDTAAYPSRPVTIICPMPPGGGTDLLCRTFANSFSSRFGRAVNVNNVAGAAGALGHARLLTAAQDGYTVGLIVFEIIPAELQGVVPVKAADFDFLAKVNEDPAAIAVRADSACQTIADFVRLSKEGAPLKVGNSGVGSVWHMAAELFAKKSGARLVNVPFDGASNAATALIGGHIDAVSVSAAELKAHAESGKVRILAVMSQDRLPFLPQTPTCKEAGIDVTFSTWRAFALPKGCPDAARAALLSAIEGALKEPELQALSTNTGVNLSFEDGASFAKKIEAQKAQIKPVMQSLKLIKNED